MGEPTRHVDILLIEDNEADINLTIAAFRDAIVQSHIHVVKDGEEAIAYLQGVGKYGSRDEYPLPDLMLLDLKMPKVGGFEVLSWIRSHPTLRALCVVVLTTSNDMRDVNRAYELGATSYFRKPDSLEGLDEMIHVLHAYWLKFNHFPE